MSEAYRKFDAADYIKSEEDARGLLSAAMDEDPGDGTVIRAALRQVGPDAEHERPCPRHRAKPRQPLLCAV